jgi:hypothetical protein
LPPGAPEERACESLPDGFRQPGDGGAPPPPENAALKKPMSYKGLLDFRSPDPGAVERIRKLYPGWLAEGLSPSEIMRLPLAERCLGAAVAAREALSFLLSLRAHYIPDSLKKPGAEIAGLKIAIILESFFLVEDAAGADAGLVIASAEDAPEARRDACLAALEKFLGDLGLPSAAEGRFKEAAASLFLAGMKEGTVLINRREAGERLKERFRGIYKESGKEWHEGAFADIAARLFGGEGKYFKAPPKNAGESRLFSANDLAYSFMSWRKGTGKGLDYAARIAAYGALREAALALADLEAEASAGERPALAIGEASGAMLACLAAIRPAPALESSGVQGVLGLIKHKGPENRVQAILKTLLGGDGRQMAARRPLPAGFGARLAEALGKAIANDKMNAGVKRREPYFDILIDLVSKASGVEFSAPTSSFGHRFHLEALSNAFSLLLQHHQTALLHESGRLELLEGAAKIEGLPREARARMEEITARLASMCAIEGGKYAIRGKAAEAIKSFFALLAKKKAGSLEARGAALSDFLQEAPEHGCHKPLLELLIAGESKRALYPNGKPSPKKILSFIGAAESGAKALERKMPAFPPHNPIDLSAAALFGSAGLEPVAIFRGMPGAEGGEGHYRAAFAALAGGNPLEMAVPWRCAYFHRELGKRIEPDPAFPDGGPGAFIRESPPAARKGGAGGAPRLLPAPAGAIAVARDNRSCRLAAGIGEGGAAAPSFDPAKAAARLFFSKEDREALRAEALGEGIDFTKEGDYLRFLRLAAKRPIWLSAGYKLNAARGPAFDFAKKIGLVFDGACRFLKIERRGGGETASVPVPIFMLPSGCRIMGIDLNMGASAASFIQTVSNEEMEHICALFGEEFGPENVLRAEDGGSIALRLPLPAGQKAGHGGRDFRLFHFARINPEKLADGTPAPSQWAAVLLSKTVQLPGGRPGDIREAHAFELLVACRMEARLGFKATPIDLMAYNGYGSTERQKGVMAFLSGKARGPKTREEIEEIEPCAPRRRFGSRDRKILALCHRLAGEIGCALARLAAIARVIIGLDAILEGGKGAAPAEGEPAPSEGGPAAAAGGQAARRARLRDLLALFLRQASARHIDDGARAAWERLAAAFGRRQESGQRPAQDGAAPSIQDGGKPSIPAIEALCREGSDSWKLPAAAKAELERMAGWLLEDKEAARRLGRSLRRLWGRMDANAAAALGALDRLASQNPERAEARRDGSRLGGLSAGRIELLSRVVRLGKKHSRRPIPEGAAARKAAIDLDGLAAKRRRLVKARNQAEAGALKLLALTGGQGDGPELFSGAPSCLCRIFSNKPVHIVIMEDLDAFKPDGKNARAKNKLLSSLQASGRQRALQGALGWVGLALCKGSPFSTSFFDVIDGEGTLRGSMVRQGLLESDWEFHKAAKRAHEKQAGGKPLDIRDIYFLSLESGAEEARGNPEAENKERFCPRANGGRAAVSPARGGADAGGEVSRKNPDHSAALALALRAIQLKGGEFDKAVLADLKSGKICLKGAPAAPPDPRLAIDAGPGGPILAGIAASGEKGAARVRWLVRLNGAQAARFGQRYMLYADYRKLVESEVLEMCMARYHLVPPI